MSAQKNSNKNILTLSLVEEPITLQKNRIQGYLGYQYEMFRQYYDNNGQRLNIIDHGLVSSMNQINYYLNFGLTDNLQIGLQHKYANGYEGFETYIKAFYEETINFTSVKEITGFSDILFNVGYRISTKNKGLEIGFFPGIYLPLSHNPKEPNYRVLKTENSNKTWTNLDFTTFEKVSTGTFRFELASKAKLRFNKRIAVQVFGKYNFPMASTNSTLWESIFNGQLYSHQKINSTYSPAHELLGNMECQLVPDKKEIMGLILGVSWGTNFNEWSKINDVKTTTPRSSLCRINTGLELIVSENIRFHQHFWYDISGRNTNGALGMQTSLTFNFIRNEK